MSPTPQLIDYVKQALAQGTDAAIIHNQLTQTGWPVEMVDEAFELAQMGVPIPPTALPAAGSIAAPMAHAMTSTQPGTIAPDRARRIRAGIWWIVSPFIILAGGLVFSFILRRGGASPLVNIVLLLIGAIGVVMIPVGLIVGLIKITKQS